MGVLDYIGKLFNGKEQADAAPPSAPLALKSAQGIAPQRNEWSWLFDKHPIESLKHAVFDPPAIAEPPVNEFSFLGLEPAHAAPPDAPKLKLDTKNPFEEYQAPGAPKLKVDTTNPFEGLSGSLAMLNNAARLTRRGAKLPPNVASYDPSYGANTLGVRG